MEHLRRPTGTGTRPGVAADLGDETFIKKCPALAEFLCEEAWPDGATRETGTLLLFASEGQWKVMVKDRDGKRVAFLSAKTLQGLFDAVEKHLRADTLDWRADKGPPGGKRR